MGVPFRLTILQSISPTLMYLWAALFKKRMWVGKSREKVKVRGFSPWSCQGLSPSVGECLGEEAGRGGWTTGGRAPSKTRGGGEREELRDLWDLWQRLPI